jgi:hypothetical protein
MSEKATTDVTNSFDGTEDVSAKAQKYSLKNAAM